nr:DNA-directed RNA polymerase subunit alpha C-terminal domain-containing protein [uncultured Acetatifactor sp.]
MSNYIWKTGHKEIANITSLTPDAYNVTHMSERASWAVESFLQTAWLLPGNGFLGWQMNSDKTGLRAFAFSKGDVKMTSGDFGWIFEEYADVEAQAPDFFEDLYRDFPKVYVLRHMPGISDELRTFRSRHLPSEDTDYLQDVVRAVKESGGVVRIVVETGHDSQGVILFCLAEEMTLQMRALLSLAFPDTVLEEADMADADTDFGLPAKYLMESMKRLLEVFLLEDSLLLDSTEDPFTEDPSAEDSSAEDSFTEDPFTEDSFTEDSSLDSGDPAYRFRWENEDDLDAAYGYDDPEEYDAEDPAARSLPGAGGKSGGGETSDQEPDSLLLDEMDLSVRTYVCLKRAGIHTLGDLRKMSREDLAKIRNLGSRSLEEVINKLASMGLSLQGEQAPPSSSDMLAQLIGLKDVKEQVRKIAAFARMKKDMETLGRTSVPVALNMEFVGNPGTAKTTVARILAGIFQEIGILSSSQIVEAGRADLVAGYIGQTAINVKSVFKRARGKLLFIDEAYSLASDSQRDFGYEAINTIVQEMENSRSDTVVVFAGYPEEMENFFSMNPGLRSRVPFRISFPDYSTDEMAQIVALEAQKRGFSLCPRALEKAVSLCGEAKHRSDAGNGRFCRNLVENAILGYALRVYGEGAEAADGAVKDFILGEEDFSLPDNMQAIPERQEAKKTAPIGFR